MLEKLGQESFAAGIVRGVARDRMPSSSAYDILDGLLDEGGNVFRRGAAALMKDASGEGPVQWVWGGTFPGDVGYRLAFATWDQLWVSKDDGATFTGLGTGAVSAQTLAAMVGGILHVGSLPGDAGSGSGGGFLWAGGTLSNYSTGTVSVAKGTRGVVGVGTAWLTHLEPGMLIRFDGSSGWYVVKEVQADNLLIIDRPYSGTVSVVAGGYEGKAVAESFVAARFYATIGDRAIAVWGSEVHTSAGRDPETGYPQPYNWDDYDLNSHVFPSEIVGVAVQRDRLLVFTQDDGVAQITGLAQDVVDVSGNALHSIEHVSDLLLWGPGGLARWNDAVIAATRSGVWAIDGLSAPTSLSRSIDTILNRLLNYPLGSVTVTPGQAAVYEDHLLLPVVLDGDSRANADMLICKLDAPVRTSLGIVYPWTRFTGNASVRAAAVSVEPLTGRQRLVGGRSNSKLMDFDAVWRPANADDEELHALRIDFRDFTLARGNMNLTRRARLRFETVGDPELVLSVDDDEVFYTELESGGVDDGRQVWAVERRGQSVRLRLTVQPVAPAEVTLRSVELWVRPSRRTS